MEVTSRISLRKEVVKIIGYDNGTFELIVNGQKRRVSSIKFSVSINEAPTLITTELL